MNEETPTLTGPDLDDHELGRQDVDRPRRSARASASIPPAPGRTVARTNRADRKAKGDAPHRLMSHMTTVHSRLESHMDDLSRYVQRHPVRDLVLRAVIHDRMVWLRSQVKASGQDLEHACHNPGQTREALGTIERLSAVLACTQSMLRSIGQADRVASAMAAEKSLADDVDKLYEAMLTCVSSVSSSTLGVMSAHHRDLRNALADAADRLARASAK